MGIDVVVAPLSDGWRGWPKKNLALFSRVDQLVLPGQPFDYRRWRSKVNSLEYPDEGQFPDHEAELPWYRVLPRRLRRLASEGRWRHRAPELVTVDDLEAALASFQRALSRRVGRVVDWPEQIADAAWDEYRPLRTDIERLSPLGSGQLWAFAARLRETPEGSVDKLWTQITTPKSPWQDPAYLRARDQLGPFSNVL